MNSGKYMTLIIDVNCYIEDAYINGVEDSPDKMLMPFLTKTDQTRDGNWKIEIDIATGKIKDWPQGTTADVHYKCCDEGIYIVIDENGKKILSHDGYVPKCLDFYGEGFGDYIIMGIDGNGVIQKWDSKAVIEWTLSKAQE